MRNDPRDLVVWREAVSLLANVLVVSSRLPATIRGPILDAAVSVPASVAEGLGLGSREEFLGHLFKARKSLSELGALVAAAEQLGNLPPDELEILEHGCAEVAAPLHGLIDHVRRDVAACPSIRDDRHPPRFLR